MKYKETKIKNGLKIEFLLPRNIKIGECQLTHYIKENNFLHSFYIDEFFRNLGYGQEVLRYLIKKYDFEYLNVKESNKVALHIYKKFGFITCCDVNVEGIPMLRMIRKNGGL